MKHDTKKCSRCQGVKPVTDFYTRKDRGYKPISWCKECKSADSRGNPHQRQLRQIRWKRDIEKSRAYSRLNAQRQKHRKLGLKPHQFQEMLAQQNGLCAICNNPETAKLNGRVRELGVDHCHSTGRVRGLLCSRCNQAIGLFSDSTARLASAIDYLIPGFSVIKAA